MSNENIPISVKEFINLKKYLVRISEDNQHLQEEMIIIKEALNNISGAVIELEKYVTRIEDELTKGQKRIGKVCKYLDKKEEKWSKVLPGFDGFEEEEVKKTEPERKISKEPVIENKSSSENTRNDQTSVHPKDDKESTRVPMEAKVLQETKVELIRQEIVGDDDEKTKKKDADSVMIFISPEYEEGSHGRSDSTRASRRQLMPTTDEEKILLGYLENNDAVITQGEYERLLKELSSMLISAPKNAVAIEIKKIETASEHNTLELCYHINVKNDLTKACFNYFEYKGK